MLLPSGSVSGQICSTLKAQIAQGVYGPGSPLPSTRALAIEMGVSRTTVTAAYEQLLAEGYLESRQGAKTRVASGFRSPADVPKSTLPPKGTKVRLSGFGNRVAGFPANNPTGARSAIDFRYGDLSAADFPVLAWKRTLNRQLLRRQDRLGHPQLPPNEKPAQEKCRSPERQRSRRRPWHALAAE